MDSLVDIADMRGGVVTRTDIAAAGLTPAQLRTAVRRRELLRLHHGVYAVRHLWPDNRDDQLVVRCRGLLLLCPPGTAVSHTTAAVVDGLAVIFRPRVDVLHVTVPYGAPAPRLSGCRLHRARAPLETATAYGLRVTTMSRTVLDVARLGDVRLGVACADSALAGRPRLDLRGELARCYGWPGYRQAARVIELADGRAESPLESLARLVWLGAGLPPPLLQASIRVDDVFVGRVDFLWPKHRVIVEVDGMGKYADPAELAYEKRRQNTLMLAGYVVLRFTWTDIVNRPEACAAAVRRALLAAETGPAA